LTFIRTRESAWPSAARLSPEVRATVEHGEEYPVRFGRSGFRRNFAFEGEWRGKYYRTKQLEVIAVAEGDRWLALTVIVRYF